MSKRPESEASDTTNNSTEQKSEEKDPYDEVIVIKSRYSKLEVAFLKQKIKDKIKVDQIVSNYKSKFTKSERQNKSIKNKIKSLIKDKEYDDYQDLIVKAILFTGSGSTKKEISTWIKENIEENTNIKHKKINIQKSLNAAVENNLVKKQKHKGIYTYSWDKPYSYEIFGALYTADLIKKYKVDIDIINFICLCYGYENISEKERRNDDNDSVFDHNKSVIQDLEKGIKLLGLGYKLSSMKESDDDDVGIPEYESSDDSNMNESSDKEYGYTDSDDIACFSNCDESDSDFLN